MTAILRIRLLADKNGQERIVRFDPITGEKKLVNPATEGDAHEPWPLKGAIFTDEDGERIDGPKTCTISQRYAQEQPFIELINPTIKTVPAGPPADPFSKTPHIFTQCDAIVFHMFDRDYRYRVVKNPGKYDTETDVEVESPADPTTYITWEYQLELEGAGR